MAVSVEAANPLTMSEDMPTARPLAITIDPSPLPPAIMDKCPLNGQKMQVPHAWDILVLTILVVKHFSWVFFIIGQGSQGETLPQVGVQKLFQLQVKVQVKLKT
jgi:hypothetical protein